MTRPELQELLTSYEQLAQSPSASADQRARARYESTLIRARLRDGDFQTGDRVALRVMGEPALSDTFVVNRERMLDLPDIGEIPLHGVLRSELQDHLTRELGRKIRDPMVRAHTMIRLSIEGAVGQPGFYVRPTDEVLTDALMAAGGPADQAAIRRMRIERAGEPIWAGDALQQAIIEGRTLDQLNLRAGDRIIVPQRTNYLRSEYIYAFSLLLSLGLTIRSLIF